MSTIDEQIKQQQEEMNALNWKLHRLKRQKAKDDAEYEKVHAKELGFSDVGDYHSYLREVELGHYDWDGNVNLENHGNLASIVRTKPSWSTVIPGFIRNAYIALFFDQWNKTPLDKSELLTPAHGDYQNFLNEGYGPLTNAEVELIKSGKGDRRDEGLTFG